MSTLIAALGTVVLGMPEAEYHALPHCSNSRLTILQDRSPAHVLASMQVTRKDTDELLLGRAIHCAVLEPDRFPSSYVRGVAGDGRTKAVQEARAALVAEYPGATVLKPDHFEIAIAARDAVRAHPTAAALLARVADTEVTAIWEEPEHEQLPCKLRADGLAPSIEAVVDLKTTTNASRDAFEKSIWNYGYARQAVFYRRGLAAAGADGFSHHVIIAVEKEPPFAVAVYELLPEAEEAAAQQLRRLLPLYARCWKANEWPAYPTEITYIGLPAWAYGRV